jgi:hypothetical protein
MSLILGLGGNGQQQCLDMCGVAIPRVRLYWFCRDTNLENAQV